MKASKGQRVHMVSLDGSREMRQDQWLLIVLPFVAGVTFIIAVLTSGGYLCKLSWKKKKPHHGNCGYVGHPHELMAGKIIGNISVGLT